MARRRTDFERDFRDVHGEDAPTIELQPEVAAWSRPRLIRRSDPMPGASLLARLVIGVPLLLLTLMVGLVGIGLIMFGLTVIAAIIKGPSS